MRGLLHLNTQASWHSTLCFLCGLPLTCLLLTLTLPCLLAPCCPPLQVRINWAFQKEAKEEQGSHVHVFVGDLSSDVTDATLHQVGVLHAPGSRLFSFFLGSLSRVVADAGRTGWVPWWQGWPGAGADALQQLRLLACRASTSVSMRCAGSGLRRSAARCLLPSAVLPGPLQPACSLR